MFLQLCLRCEVRSVVALLVRALIFFKEKSDSSNFFRYRTLEANTENKGVAMCHAMEVRLSVLNDFVASQLDRKPELQLDFFKQVF